MKRGETLLAVLLAVAALVAVVAVSIVRANADAASARADLDRQLLKSTTAEKGWAVVGNIFNTVVELATGTGEAA